MLALQLIVAGLLLGGVYALISLGLTLIFGVLRIINFAHGQLVMWGMYASYVLYTWLGLDPYLSVPVVAILFFGIGLGLYQTVIGPTTHLSPSFMLIITLGLSLALESLALLVFGAEVKSVKTFLGIGSIQLYGLIIDTPRLFAFCSAIAVSIGFYASLKYTLVGNAVRATIQDRQGAELLSIDTKSISRFAFGVGTACAGIGGSLLLPILNVFPSIAFTISITSFVVVVLGGLGNIGGAILAGLIIGVTETISGFLIAPDLKESIYFAIFVLVLIVNPSGFFGLGKGYEEVGLK